MAAASQSGGMLMLTALTVTVRPHRTVMNQSSSRGDKLAICHSA